MSAGLWKICRVLPYSFAYWENWESGSDIIHTTTDIDLSKLMCECIYNIRDIDRDVGLFRFFSTY